MVTPKFVPVLAGITLSLSSCAIQTELLSITDHAAVQGEVSKAAKLIGSTVPVDPNIQFTFEKIDGPLGTLGQVRGKTIVFDQDELWVRWEEVADFETRPVVDLRSVAAHEIAHLCGATHSPDGWAVSPGYQVVR
ncbi:MAG: matrixin family metalloprotease, partial [Verrucomicrobiales bacterium]